MAAQEEDQDSDESPALVRDRKILIYISMVLAAVISVFLIAHLFYPGLTIDTTTIGLLGLLVVVCILPFAKSITLPGGSGITFERKVARAQRAVNAAIPEKERAEIATKKPTIVKPQDMTWRDLMQSDVNLGLAGLRIEIEKKLGLLAKKNGIDLTRATISEMVRRMVTTGVLLRNEEQAIQSVVSVLNAAVHGQKIPDDAVGLASDLGESILRILDAKLEAGSIP